MGSLTGIVCPMDCSLLVAAGPLGDDGFPMLTITGNHGSRGAVYAQEEIRVPKRVVTATCGIVVPGDEAGSGNNRSPWAPRRVPVKTRLACPKEKITELLEDIYKVRHPLPVKAGDAVIANWRGTGIDVVAVRTVG
ncbi:MAG: DUF1667 domain-containing protein [Treponema sp.]|nr:DUF1667 domain-containing protein [Treponema sp.]